MPKAQDNKMTSNLEKQLLESFIDGFNENNEFHTGMKAMNLALKQLGDDLHENDFSKGFKALLKSFNTYWAEVNGSMNLEKLETARRDFCFLMEDMLSTRFEMDMDDWMYEKIHDYTI